MSINDFPVWLFIVVLFAVSFIFSFIAYLEKHIGEITKDNSVKMYIRGALHSTIGALIAVVVYSVQVEYWAESNFLLKISMSVMAAVLSDTLLLRARKEIGERDV